MQIQTTDYHTAGEPFRIVSGGAPLLQGRTVLERRASALRDHDRVRQLLIFEPRGHADMYGCFVLRATTRAPISATSSSTTPGTRPPVATARSPSSPGRSRADWSTRPTAGSSWTSRADGSRPCARRGRSRSIGALPQRPVVRRRTGDRRRDAPRAGDGRRLVRRRLLRVGAGRRARPRPLAALAAAS